MKRKYRLSKQTESGHNTTGSETYFCRKGKHFKHQGASLSALITQWVILSLLQIPLPNLYFITLLTLLHTASSAEFKSVSCKTRRVYSPLLIIISELCSLKAKIIYSAVLGAFMEDEGMKKILTKKMLCCTENEQTSARS